MAASQVAMSPGQIFSQQRFYCGKVVYPYQGLTIFLQPQGYTLQS